MSSITARRGLVLLAAGLLVAAACLAIRSTANAQAPAGRTLTFSELDKGSTFTHIRNTKTKSRSANSQGDVLALANRLVDADGTPIGKLHLACTTTVGARDFTKSIVTCHGVLALRDGTLTLQCTLEPGADTTGAITGGTGAYANARGVVVSRLTKTGADDTVTLVE
jgi:allene oxide cyclase